LQVRSGGSHTKCFAEGVVAKLTYKDEILLGFDPGTAELGCIQFFREAACKNKGTVEREVLQPPIIFGEVVLEVSEVLSKGRQRL